MTISDQTRHRLHQRLDEVLGPDDAATLMEHLPPVGWADVATKRDLDHLATQLRSEMGTGFDSVRSEMALGFVGLRAEFREEIWGLRTELHKELGALRGDMARQLPTLFVGLVALQVSAAGLGLALSRGL